MLYALCVCRRDAGISEDWMSVLPQSIGYLHTMCPFWLKLLVSLASVICLVLNQPLRRWIAELLLGLIGKRKQ